MNEIKLTVELCDKDRARLDKIIDLLETRAIQAQADLEYKLDKPSDELTEMLKEAISTDPVDTPKNAQDDVKASDHPTLDPFPEAPTATEEPSEAAEEKEEPTVTLEMLKSKVIMISAAGKKDQVREIVLSYAPKVTELPDNVWAEVYKKLCALEG